MYLLQCLCTLFLANGENFHDSLIGLAVLVVLVGVFFAVNIPLSWYTKLKGWQSTLIAIAADVAFVFVFCVLSAVIEKVVV